jgi:tetratricopeptide (TPR) repeat protein
MIELIWKQRTPVFFMGPALLAISTFFWVSIYAHAATPPKFRPILPAAIQPKINPKTKAKIPLTKEQETSNRNSSVETLALESAAKGDFSTAITRYSSLLKSFDGTRLASAIDLRILELHRLNLKPGGSPDRYQKSLIAAQEKYKNDDALGANSSALTKKIYATVTQMHRNLISNQIAQAREKSASPSFRKQTIKTIDSYLDIAPDEEKVKLRSAKGDLQFLSDNHIGAAATFAALATESKGPQADAFWRLAIRSQHFVSTWPTNPPWDGAKPSSPSAIETLKGMYTSLSNHLDWESLSHIGLIHLNLGNQTEAFKLFTEQIERNPQGANAQQAAGLMASRYLKAKSWPQLENLGRTLIAKKIKGIHQKVSFEGRSILGTALVEGGLEKYAAGEYKDATLKLDEFVNGWAGHPKFEQAYYQLALAHYANKSYKTALETLVNFTKSFPKSTYRRDSLVTGGSWALALAWEDHVMYFLETHAKEFSKNKEVVSSLEMLASLYMGREFYDEASRIMETQLVNPLVDVDAKADIARRLLDMHERHGSTTSSLRASSLVLTRFPNLSPLAAPALSLQARTHNTQQKLEETLKKLNNLEATDPSVIEAKSEIHFLMAESLAKSTFDKEIFSLGSRNPLGDLNAANSKYETIKSLYRQACTTQGASWCGPSMHRLARVSEKFSASVTPLDIPRTLDSSIVQPFLNRKKSILEAADTVALEADEKSVAEANAGATNPDWTGAILWQNLSDWQSVKVVGETGVGYLQWNSGTQN